MSEKMVNCCICGKEIPEFGVDSNNPAPFGGVYDRCCNSCNESYVIPARIIELYNTTPTTRDGVDLSNDDIVDGKLDKFSILSKIHVWNMCETREERLAKFPVFAASFDA